MENCLDDPTSRVFNPTFASHKRHLEIFYDILGSGWKLVYLTDLFYLANRELFGRSDKWSCLSDICISLATLRNIYDVLGPGWKVVYLIDSFYLANREFLDDPTSRVFYPTFASH